MIFLRVGGGATVLNAGAFAAYFDTYLGGDGVINDASVILPPIREPSTALRLLIGLAGLSATADPPEHELAPYRLLRGPTPNGPSPLTDGTPRNTRVPTPARSPGA